MKNDILIYFEYNPMGSDLLGLDDFEEKIKEAYTAFIRPNRGIIAGELCNVLIEIFIDLTLDEFVSDNESGNGWKQFEKNGKKYHIRPFLTLTNELEENNNQLYFEKVKVTFSDVQVKFYGVENDLDYIMDGVFKELQEKADTIYKQSGDNFFTIYTPLIVQPNEGINKYMLDDFQGGALKDDYFQYWGLSYHHEFGGAVFDVKDNKVLNVKWGRFGDTF